jgi:putative exporter of polyketide antibiotics
VAALATVFVSLAPMATVGAVAAEARPGTLFAWHMACLLAVALAILGVLFALQIRRRDAFYAARGYELEEESTRVDRRSTAVSAPR